jgi:hypothetical protein
LPEAGYTILSGHGAAHGRDNIGTKLVVVGDDASRRL